MSTELIVGPDDRTTAVGLYHLALSYQACADRLRAIPPDDLMFDAPLRFLFWHAAELFLKAFLRADGLTLGQLRNRGHKHTQIHEECCARGLDLGPYSHQTA